MEMHVTQVQLSAAAMVGLLLLGSAAHASSRPEDWGMAVNGGAEGNSRYWPFDQITKQNVSRLQVVWRRPSVDPTLRQKFEDLEPKHNYAASPLIVDGVGYISNAVGLVEAFDPTTGKTLWIQEPVAPGLRGVSGTTLRNLAYWRDKSGATKRIITVNGEDLYALDANTGKVVSSFGRNGRVSLHYESPYKTRFRAIAGPVVVSDVIVMGGGDGGLNDFNVTKDNAADDIRGYDVRDGKLLWTFHVVPRPGQVGHETWENDAWKTTGSMGAWAPLTVDAQLGYVYIPTSAPANSWYGGHRPGANLFSSSIVCLNASTGERVWHFQLVHHDIWDYDVASPPTLGDVVVDGKPVKAVMQPTKPGFVFVFDRVTGKPLWPIEERPAPPSQTPGEHAYPTQPFPTKPKPIDLQGVSVNDLIDFTPELRAQALKMTEDLAFGPLYTPPLVASSGGKRGLLTAPGTAGAPNWGGGAFDPASGMYYVASHTQVWINDLVPPPPEAKATVPYVHGPAADAIRRNEDYSASIPMLAPGLPLVKPPYSRITAINMNTGDHVWMAPNGDGPRHHPLLKGLKLPALGSGGRAAPMLTKTLLFVGEGSPIIVATPQGMGGAGFRAFDKTTGQQVWATTLDAGTTGAPVSYMAKGKQYIVVAIGDEKHSAELVALALPDK